MSVKFVKTVIAAGLVVFSLSSHALRVGNLTVPDGPDRIKTPGALCQHPTGYRYSERIPYCERNVSSELKKQIIRDYDQKLGYDIQKLPRGDFKIDHFIPLSIGGANDETNLWPQYKNVYAYSDPLESEVSMLMNEGSIKQAEAIKVIKECKLNLTRCADLLKYLQSLHKN